MRMSFLVYVECIFCVMQSSRYLDCVSLYKLLTDICCEFMRLMALFVIELYRLSLHGFVVFSCLFLNFLPCVYSS